VEKRPFAKVPHGHWKTMTLVAALRIDGISAPYVIDGAMYGPAFLAYVEQELAPTLRKGDIVCMDNLQTHKVNGSSALSSGLLARSQPDRAGVLQAERGFAERCRAHRRDAVEAHWQASRDICA
jgi:hypothetical protein